MSSYHMSHSTDSCIFCKIVRGELPCTKVYEDERFLAFLDKYPRAAGHCLVIPKEHFRWVWDVPDIGAYMEATKKVANAQRKAFGTEMVISKILGDEVPHAHIWLIPQRHSKNESLEGELLAKAIQECL